MIDYRDIHYTPEDLNNVRRRIRNSALTVEELVVSLTDAEVAAMWFEVESEYNYCFLRDNPAEQILFYYLRETLIKAIASDECELNNQEIKHYFNYWYTMHD